MKLVKIGATWCGPCKMLSKTMESVDLSEYNIVEIDVDAQREQAMKYGVRGVPVLVVENDEGVELRRSSGYKTTQQLKEFLGI